MAGRSEGFKAWATILAPVLGAVVLGIMGLWIQARIANASTAREYVQLSLTILRDGEGETTSAESRELRNWAVAVFLQFSPVVVTEEAKQALLRTGLPGPPTNLRFEQPTQ